MDPALSRLASAAGRGACAPAGAATMCADNEAFEHLASELAVALAPAVSAPANGDGARGFYLGLSSSWTAIRGQQSYWALGTRGSERAAAQNPHVDSVLVWNRLEVRKGLPWGLEVGSAIGQGVDTSLWVLSGQIRVILFEGFRSGLGALPDVALRAATQEMFGSSELSVRTQALDVTLSKPFVIAQAHRVTPLLSLQALFVHAESNRIDLTPGKNAFRACAPSTPASDGLALGCTSPAGDSELANIASFRTVSNTRVRLFVGAEERYRFLSVAATFGLDVAVPRLRTETPGEALPTDLMRQFSLHLACGLRY